MLMSWLELLGHRFVAYAALAGVAVLYVMRMVSKARYEEQKRIMHEKRDRNHEALKKRREIENSNRDKSDSDIDDSLSKWFRDS